MQTLATALLSPLGASLTLGVAAVAVGARGFKRIAVWIGLMAVTWLWLWSTPWASLTLRQHIEGEFPPLAMTAVPAAQAIVVIGGAMAPPGPGRPYPDLTAGADRVWHGARLFHAGKAPLLVLSGGGDPARGPVSEAEAMRTFLLDLGVPQAAMVLESDSRNTRQNAHQVARLLRARGVNRVLLVTSALHMRRALTHFRAEGLDAVPVATDHSSAEPASALSILPDADALDGSTRALKEWVGQWIWSSGG